MVRLPPPPRRQGSSRPGLTPEHRQPATMDDVLVDIRQRLHVRVAGLVQGVGFRPFVYRTADELGLAGFVENNDRGVDIEVEGPSSALDAFLDRMESGAPPLVRFCGGPTVDLTFFSSLAGHTRSKDVLLTFV